MLLALIYLSPYLFPAYLLRFTVLGIPLNVLEIFTYVLFFLWIIERLRDRSDFVWNSLCRRYFYAALLFLIGASLGALFTPHFVTLPDGNILDARRIALGVWKAWIIAPLLCFIVLSQTLKTPARVERLLRHFVYSAALVSLLSYAYALFGGGITYDDRLRGMFESANYLALYIAPALMLGLWFFFSGKANRYLSVAAMTILACTLLFTQSYAAILSIIGALFLYFVRQFTTRKYRARDFLLSSLFVAVILLAVIAGQWNTNKFQQFLNFSGRSSTSVRLEIYRVSAHLISARPFLGIGLGQFQSQYQLAAPDVLGREPLEWNMPHPHNIFLAFWLNAGLLGLLSLLLLLILSHQTFTYPLLALWTIIIHGLFDVPFWKNDLAMIFWLILASIFILQNHATHSRQKPAH